MQRKEQEQPINIFKEILRDNWDEFKKRYRWYDTAYYNEVIEKMINCGNIKYGYSRYMCLLCGQESVLIPFSCKSKFCLSCGKVFSENQTEEISSKMHDGAIYRHISLTIPEQLRPYFYRDRHKGNLLRRFFKTGWECIQDVIKTVKRKELECGAIVVLHNCGRKGDYKPHLHILMLDGGFDEEKGQWVNLGYFPYEILHKKWQYHLFNMMQEEINTDEMDELISELWKKYPKGLVANVKPEKVPAKSKGLARYLTKYLSSPTISLKRIKKYDPDQGIVEYLYRSHETKKIEKETTDVLTFIGRMVQQILPKGFQRIHYFGLQATKTFKKHAHTLMEVFKKGTKIAAGCYRVIKKKYRERYKDSNRGKDPFICSKCGTQMDLVTVWSPSYGFIYDWFEGLQNAPPVEEPKEVSEKKPLARLQQLAFDFMSRSLQRYLPCYNL